MAMTLLDIAQALREADRVGTEIDEPEGSRNAVISDTLANIMADCIERHMASRQRLIILR